MGFVCAGRLRWSSLVPLFLTLIATDVRAFAVEPTAEFVQGLQARGLHSLALDYLEEMKTSPLANDAVRRQIPYLRGEGRESADVPHRSRAGSSSFLQGNRAPKSVGRAPAGLERILRSAQRRKPERPWR